MVKRILALLHTEISGLHEAAFLLGLFALGAKGLGLIRDRFLADAFGATLGLDIYYAAFRIPDFIYVSLASLVASAVLIPFIIDRLEKGSGAREFFNDVFTLFSIAILLASVLAFFVMPTLSFFVAPGFDGEARGELVLLSRILLLSPILLGLSGLFASVTQSLRRFLVYALAPVLYNVGIIGGIIFFYPTFGLPGLAYGVVLGAFLHMAIQIPALWQYKFLPRISFHIRWEDVKRVLTLSLPRTITLSAHHMALLVLVAMASYMAEGSITIFNLAFNLQSVPLDIIGVSYSIAAFPTLARFFSNKDYHSFTKHILTAARHIIFWSFPILVLFIVLRAQIVRTILGTGQFDWSDTRLTAAALALFIISTISQSLMILFVRGYYAGGRTIKPLFINVFSLGVVVGLAFFLNGYFNSSLHFRYFLESLLRIEDIQGSEILVLPLAFSLGALLNIGLLWYFFKKDFGVKTEELTLTLRQSFFAAVIMGFVAHQFLRIFDNVFDINTFVGIFSQGLFSGLLGLIAGVLVLKIIRNKEIQDIQATIRQKFWKSRPIVPDKEGL